MIKKITLLFICMGCLIFVEAQKQYNMWYFGTKAAINFNTTPTTGMLGSQLSTFESSTSICDSNGRVLFYTNGDTMFNRLNRPLKNFNCPISKDHFSSRQGSMALPVPKSNHLYYLITVDGDDNQSPFYLDGYIRYSIIDMNGDGGLGEAVVLFKPLGIINPRENFGVSLHANGIDYWIASIDDVNGFFYCKRTVNGAFDTTFPIEQKLTNSDLISNCNKFSPDSKIFLSHLKMNPGNSGYTEFLYKFNNSDGTLSDQVSINCDIYNALGNNGEFSPDSRFLYTRRYYYKASINRMITEVLQYDLSVWNSAAINASETIVAQFINNMGLNGFQLGPDGKIYGLVDGEDYVSVINNPCLKGLACNFVLRAVSTKPNYSSATIPYYPTFMFRLKKINLGKDIVLCIGDSTRLKTNAPKNSSIEWNSGDTTESIIIKRPGTYIAKVIDIANNFESSDTINITVGPKFKVFIGNDTAFCGQFSHLIKASSGFAKYNWNTGSTAMQIKVNSKGIYTVKVLDSNTCPSGDTIAIDQIKKPVIKLSYDSINCKYIFLSTDTIKGLSYLWSTKETTNNIKVDKKGCYSLKAIGTFCSNQDSIYVNQLSQPEVNLGIDTSLCNYELQLSTKEQERYLWSTGETIPSITVNEPGQYWLTVSRNNCSASDTINVKLCEDMLYYIPSVFTPNGDNINDVFKVFGSNISFVEMEIFNRWGEKLLETSGKDANWDGFYKNELCMESVYFYKVKIKGKKVGSVKYLKGTITLLK